MIRMGRRISARESLGWELGRPRGGAAVRRGPVAGSAAVTCSRGITRVLAQSTMTVLNRLAGFKFKFDSDRPGSFKLATGS